MYIYKNLRLYYHNQVSELCIGCGLHHEKVTSPLSLVGVILLRTHHHIGLWTALRAQHWHHGMHWAVAIRYQVLLTYGIFRALTHKEFSEETTKSVVRGGTIASAGARTVVWVIACVGARVEVKAIASVEVNVIASESLTCII